MSLFRWIQLEFLDEIIETLFLNEIQIAIYLYNMKSNDTIPL